MRLESGGCHCVRHNGLLGGKESEGNLLSVHLKHKCGDLLLNSICEVELKDGACDGGEHRLVADDDTVPGLLLTPGGCIVECVSVVTCKSCGAIHTVDLKEPTVCGAGAHTLCLKCHGYLVAVSVEGSCENCAVVECVANSHAALTVGTLFYDVREVRSYSLGLEAETEWNVLSMDTQVTETAILTVELDHSLPVDGLICVHIGAVVEAAVDLKDLTELAFLEPVDHCLHSGVVGELGAAANEYVRISLDSLHDLVVGRLVDTEGLSPRSALPLLIISI